MFAGVRPFHVACNDQMNKSDISSSYAMLCKIWGCLSCVAECSAMLLGEFDFLLNQSTVCGVGQFSWTAWPWRWKLCDCLNHQQPLTNKASHPWRLESVVHLRWHRSVSISASLMMEYGDVIMWSRRWWQTCGVSGLETVEWLSLDLLKRDAATSGGQLVGRLFDLVLVSFPMQWYFCFQRVHDRDRCCIYSSAGLKDWLAHQHDTLQGWICCICGLG